MIGAITAGLYGTGVPPVTNSYESIATVTVGSGGGNSISFTSIPSTYKHLQIRAFLAANNGYIADTNWTINGDTNSGNYYGFHQLTGDGSSASAQAYNGSGRLNPMPVGNDGFAFTGAVVDILDYASTTKNKTFRSLVGFDNNGTGAIRLRSSLYFPSTITAISSITIAQSVGDFKQYSSFALYGIKG